MRQHIVYMYKHAHMPAARLRLCDEGWLLCTPFSQQEEQRTSAHSQLLTHVVAGAGLALRSLVATGFGSFSVMAGLQVPLAKRPPAMLSYSPPCHPLDKFQESSVK